MVWPILYIANVLFPEHEGSHKIQTSLKPSFAWSVPFRAQNASLRVHSFVPYEYALYENALDVFTSSKRGSGLRISNFFFLQDGSGASVMPLRTPVEVRLPLPFQPLALHDSCELEAFPKAWMESAAKIQTSQKRGVCASIWQDQRKKKSVESRMI